MIYARKILFSLVVFLFIFLGCTRLSEANTTQSLYALVLNPQSSANIACPAYLVNLPAQFSVHYNTQAEVGAAQLTQVAGNSTEVILHPAGLSGTSTFISDMRQIPSIIIGGHSIPVYRAGLEISPNGSVYAYMMLGENGQCLLDNSSSK